MKNKMIGLVFHLSSREYMGRRIVDEVRKSMVRFVRSIEDEDGLYLYHPQLLDAVYSRGEKTSVIGNFETDGYKFDLGFALKQTLYVTALGYDPDVERVVLLITDNFLESDISSLKKILVLNEKEDLRCKVLVIGLGDKYHRPVLEEYAKVNPNLAYLHVKPEEIDIELKNWFDLLVEEA